LSQTYKIRGILAFFDLFCYNCYCSNLIKQTVLFSELSDEKVKGKQVRILCDLVTVIAERYTNIVTERSGRLYAVLMHKSGNLPFVGTRPKGQVTRY